MLRILILHIFAVSVFFSLQFLSNLFFPDGITSTRYITFIDDHRPLVDIMHDTIYYTQRALELYELVVDAAVEVFDFWRWRNENLWRMQNADDMLEPGFVHALMRYIWVLIFRLGVLCDLYTRLEWRLKGQGEKGGFVIGGYDLNS